MSTNDFTTLEACDATTGFNADQGTGVTLGTDTGEKVQGSASLTIVSSGSPQLIEVGNNVTAFNIKQKNVVLWIYYAKGKTAQFLTDSESAVRVRCYFGGTTPASTPYAEWDAGGNLSIPFGWSPIYASGTTASRLGNGHNGGTDYNSTVQRIALILDQANNNDGSNDPSFNTDYWHAGTKIQMTGGSAPSPLDEDDIISYDSTNALGVVIQDRSQKGLIMRCGLDVGDGTTAGYMVLKDLAILNDQLSDEVEQVWQVVDNTGGASTLILGELESGSDSDYAVQGCQLSCPATRNPNFNVEDGTTFKCYDTLFYQWGEISIGESGGSTGTREMRRVDIDACEALNINQAGSYTELEVHDAAERTQDHCGEIIATPTAFSALVHDNTEGFHFRETVTVENMTCLDMTTYDLRVLEGKDATLKNCVFDRDKTARQAT